MQQLNSSRPPWTAHLDLFGNPECDYHAHITIGSTLMNLVLDTGSSNTAVISDLCQHAQNCSFVEKPYLPVPPMHDFDKVNASYGNAKLRSSWKGFATGQLVSFDGVQQAFARIDVITENQAFFIPRCPKNQGIWGLAHHSLQTRPEKLLMLQNNKHHYNAQQHKLTLFDAIRREKGLPNAFTIQLCPKSAVDTAFSHEFNFLSQNSLVRNDSMLVKNANHAKKCQRDGHFWLGGYPSQSVGSEIVWVPLAHKRHYEVKIERFLVNGKSVKDMEPDSFPRAIIDTGTKDIVLAPKNLQKLLNALLHSKLVQFDDSVSRKHERSFWLDHAQLSVPRNALTISHNVSLAIAFEGDKQVSIPIANILNIKPFDEMPDWVNVSWTGFSSNGGGQMASTILGNTLLRGKTLIFDKGKEDNDVASSKSTIGFSDAVACCRDSSAQDVDILLSVDSVTKGAAPVENRGANTIQILLILLIAFSGVGFFSTLVIFLINHRQEKNKKLKATTYKEVIYYSAKDISK